MRMWVGGAIAVLLAITWVIAHIVMKVTSAAIHLLVVGAAILLVLQVVSRIRNKVGPGT
jgi:hypothetical protein